MVLIDNARLKWLSVPSGILLLALAGVLLIRCSAVPLLPSNAPWQVTGSFALGAVYPTTTPPPSHPSDRLLLWGSWAGSDSNTGQLTSPAFTAPELLQLDVAGYPSKPGNGIFLERIDSSARLRLRMPDGSGPGEHWQRQVWRLPAAYKNQPIRLVAVDGEKSLRGWIGISGPSSVNWFGFVRSQLPELRILPLYALDFFLFLLPGLALASFFARRRVLSPLLALALILTASALSGYFAFWIYFFSKFAGRQFSISLETASLIAAALFSLKASSARRVLRSVAAPLLCSLVAGIFYLSVLYLFTAPSLSGSDLPAVRFFSEHRPPDNEIPLIFAQRLYDRKPLEPFLGNWLSSDRPPLQAGIYLFQRCFASGRNSPLQYQLLATSLQALWICVAWMFLAQLGASRQRILQTLALLVLSGFLFFNTLYVWPKLLAGSFLLLLIAIFISKLPAASSFSRFESILCALCFSLAVLSHPGSLFSFPVFVLFSLHPRVRPLYSWRGSTLAASIVLALLFPWTAYQRYVDPPGNRLLKWHLGGQVEVDSRPAWQTISEAYHHLPATTLIEYKWANLRNIVGSHPASAFGYPAQPREEIRIQTRENIWSALGILNVGWLLAVWAGIRRRSPAVPYAGYLLAAALLNLMVWSLVIFNPGTTVTEHASAADLLLLYIGLAGFLLTLPRPALALLLALQAAGFVFFWVYTPGGNPTRQIPSITPLPQFPLAAVAAALFLLGLVLLIRYSVKTEGAQAASTPANTL